jgi:hypothetical protein
VTWLRGGVTVISVVAGVVVVAAIAGLAVHCAWKLKTEDDGYIRERYWLMLAYIAACAIGLLVLGLTAGRS